MPDKEYEWYKENPENKIWWLDNYDRRGEMVFSFDKVKAYNLFRDYPYALSPEELAIFKREEPFWAEFFMDRES